ncbi:AraC family transcriptional regulator [Pendulispora brunnea]|uniref:AraC family transcriptional regulator n=1 Tax=Pendulispora brunnea TaxID=2905690 RepID=A0ABZ2K238_9BACT
MKAYDPSPPLRFIVYVGAQRFVLLAESLVLDRSHAPYRRPAATLLLAYKAPMLLEVGEGVALSTQAALIAPKVARKRLAAEGLVAIDFPIHSGEYAAVQPALGGEDVVALDFGRFAPLVPTLARGFAGNLGGAEVKALIRELVMAISGKAPEEQGLDPRVEKAMQLINDLPREEATPASVARRLHLSTSRLGHLFKEQTGSTLSYFMRWVALWRGVALWTQGRSLTEVAHEVGYYDLAHLDHAFTDFFGVNPSTAMDPRHVRLIRF